MIVLSEILGDGQTLETAYRPRVMDANVHGRRLREIRVDAAGKPLLWVTLLEIDDSEVPTALDAGAVTIPPGELDVRERVAISVWLVDQGVPIDLITAETGEVALEMIAAKLDQVEAKAARE